MFLESMLKEQGMSIYRCAEISSIPYTTLREIVKGKTSILKCNVDTVYRLAKALNISIDALIEKSMMPERTSFETFKSQICHIVKNKGDINFIIDELKEDNIDMYWRNEYYREAFYLLAMVDYLSRENELPLCSKYDYIRSQKLSEPIFPRGVALAAKLSDKLDDREMCIKKAIPEFMKFNIVESEIRK